MNEQMVKMQITDCVELIIQELEKINVPVGLYDQIGIVLVKQTHNLREVAKALRAAEHRENEEAPAVSPDEI